MKILQLNPSIPVHVMNKGTGEALFLQEISKEDHLIWIVALDDSGEVWQVPNPEIRLLNNYTIGRSYKHKKSKQK